MRSKAMILSVVIAVLLVAATTGLAQSTDSRQDIAESCEFDTPFKQVNHSDSVEYDLHLKKCGSITIVANITDETPVDTGFVLEVDGELVQRTQFTQSTTGERQWTYNITPYLDVVRDNHTVTVSTFGNYTTYEFTRDISSTKPPGIPRPHITSVKIANGTIGGEPSAIAKVRVTNPSIQQYGSKLMVHTEDTDGSLYDATVPPGENRTITVELLDKRGSKIAGEARLYEGNITNEERALDQVEFVGRAGTNTTTWNESYEPVKAPWRDDHYVYQNESIETDADRNGLVPDLSETQLLYAGAGVALVVLGGLKRLLT